MQIAEDDGAGEDDAEEDDDVSFASDDDEVATVPCPHCDKPIWEEALECEHCGMYTTKPRAPWRRPWWLVLGVLVSLVCVYLWLRR